MSRMFKGLSTDRVMTEVVFELPKETTVTTVEPPITGEPEPDSEPQHVLPCEVIDEPKVVLSSQPVEVDRAMASLWSQKVGIVCGVADIASMLFAIGIYFMIGRISMYIYLID